MRPQPRMTPKEKEVFLISYMAQNGKSRRPHPHCQVSITGMPVLAVINFRTSVNVMTCRQYLSLDQHSPLSPVRARMYTHGSAEPLIHAGNMDTLVQCAEREVKARFYVTEEEDDMLLGCHTLEDLVMVFFAKEIHSRI
ncbi:hypothetical protein NDU88_006904 [Pleurodeles waltl]|uniref:CBS domain-containing protein n=1 Tax=Pleurodeles waltl TaxID=8319 RepID=A0AAV7VQY8_PLEWA|nr:hypothetical protein NDU88_006904 [Pleurodeles waltl]